jgi:hypothetical protein
MKITKRTITCASYGGAYDIEDDQFFTREEINEVAYAVEDELNGDYPNRFGVSDVYMDGKTLYVTILDMDTGEEYETSVKIDFRKIRRPSDIKKYVRLLVYDFCTAFGCNDIYSADDVNVEPSETDGFDDDSEFDLDNLDQEYSSKSTAVNANSGKLPAIFKAVSFPVGSLVLDYGGGKEEAANIAQEYLDQFDCVEALYDPYNQTKQHNREVVKECRENGGADIALCSNVLNVIKEPEVRLDVLQKIANLTKPSGKVYITVYEGNGTGDGKVTKQNKDSNDGSWQNNMKTVGYLDEIRQVFPDAKSKGKLIYATNSGNIDSATNTCGIAVGMDTLDYDDLYEY